MTVLVGASSAVDAKAYSENSLPHLLSQTGVLTRRLLVRLVRNPMTIAYALILPVLFLLTLDVVFGDSIEAITGESALYRSVPLMALVAAMSGSTVGMVGIIGEHLDGFLTRLWVLPIHRAAGLLSGWSPKSIRLLGTTLVILCVGNHPRVPLPPRSGRCIAVAGRSGDLRCGIFGVVTMAALYWPKAFWWRRCNPCRSGPRLLHRVRAGGSVPGLGSAVRPVSADVDRLSTRCGDCRWAVRFCCR